MKDYEWSRQSKAATSNENIELVHSLIMCDRLRSLHDIARQIGKSFGAVQSILTNILGMSKVLARRVPRMLTKDHMKSRLNISKYLPSLYGDDSEEFMCRVVTQDDTWVDQFDPKAKSKVCNGSTLAHPS